MVKMMMIGRVEKVVNDREERAEGDSQIKWEKHNNINSSSSKNMSDIVDT